MAGLIGMGCLLLLGIFFGGVAYGEMQRRHAQKERENAATQEKLKTRAEQRFKDAQDAVDFMLTRVGSQRLEHEPRMEQIRRELLVKALSYYDRFLQERSEDTDLQRQTALAFKRVGDIRCMLGEYKLSEEAFASARQLFADLVEKRAAEGLNRQDLAATWTNQGNLLTEMGQQADAEKAFAEAAGPLAGTGGSRVGQPRLSVRPGPELLRPRPGEAAPWVRPTRPFICSKQAQGLQEGLAQEKPGEDIQRDLALTLGAEGLLFRQLRPGRRGRGALRRALLLREDLAPGGKGRPDDREALAKAHYNLGIYLDASDARRAAAEYREAVKLGRELVFDSPTVPAYRQTLALSFNNLGATLLADGRRAEADQAIREGLAIKEKLASDFPGKPEYRRDLAVTYSSQGLLMRTNNLPRESEAAYRKSVEVFEGLLKEADIPENRHRWAEAMVNLGTTLEAQARTKEAETIYRETLVRRRSWRRNRPRCRATASSSDIPNSCWPRCGPARRTGRSRSG